MTSEPPALRDKDGFVVWAAAYYAALCIAIGIQMPFFPLWLGTQGIDVQAIGLIIAAPMFVRIFAIPVVARLADRTGALRGILMAGSVAAAIGYAAVGFSHGFFAIFCLVAVAAIAYTPAGPLADAYTIRGLEHRGRSYGPVRLWGSVAFIVANLGAGVALDLIAPAHLIWLIVAAYAAAAFVSLGLRPLTGDSQRPSASGPSSRRLAFLVVAIAASLVQSSHAVYYGFSTIDWAHKGLDGTAIGALWGLGVASEVVLFAFAARLPIGPVGLLALGACGAVVRWSIMAWDPPVAAVAALQCLHGLSFGATQLGAIQFLARSTSEHRGATAQGDFASLTAMAMAASMSSAGFLYNALASRAYAIMALTASLGLLILIFGHIHRWLPRGSAQ